ncbi:MAG: hypothetical protein PHX21_10675 [bacterium]|nr:hypothetical protein [bacterium]
MDQKINKSAEEYVIGKLKELGVNPVKEKSYIRIINKSGALKKVKIRASSLKNENRFPAGINYFGWTVKHVGKEVEYDIFIGIGFNNNSALAYIFTSEEALKAENIGGFPQSVEKHISIFKDKNTFERALRTKPDRVSEFVKYVNTHLKKFYEKWDKIF